MTGYSLPSVVLELLQRTAHNEAAEDAAWTLAQLVAETGMPHGEVQAAIRTLRCQGHPIKVVQCFGRDRLATTYCLLPEAAGRLSP